MWIELSFWTLWIKSSIVSLSSIHGFVLAIATICVYPPYLADKVSVLIVPLCSNPGSRKWTWRSTKPGVTKRSVQSIIFSPSKSWPIWLIVSPSIYTSNFWILFW